MNVRTNRKYFIPLASILSMLLFPFSYGFDISTTCRNNVGAKYFKGRNLLMVSDPSKGTNEKTTLSDSTVWKLRFLMNNVPTSKGKRVDKLFNVDVHFLEEEGYEPPQGSIKQVDVYDNIDSAEQNENVRLRLGRWTLSEDPDDRKDGLWVWGLFAEPLYPYLLLQIETEAIQLPGEAHDSIPPLKLFAKIPHSRDKDVGVIFKPCEVNVREVETIKADPFGGATVDVFEEVNIGQLTVVPLQK